jgi:hypothetical protein
MTPSAYFSRSDTPASDSPVATLMRKILNIYPLMDLERCRREAAEALNGIGGTSRVQIAFRSWKRIDAARQCARNSAILEGN